MDDISNVLSNTDEKLTDEEIRKYQAGVENFANIIGSADKTLIERYIRDSAPQLPGGDQHEEIKKVLSVAQLAIAMRNINFYVELGKLILHARKLINQYGKGNTTKNV